MVTMTAHEMIFTHKLFLTYRGILSAHSECFLSDISLCAKGLTTC